MSIHLPTAHPSTGATSQIEKINKKRSRSKGSVPTPKSTSREEATRERKRVAAQRHRQEQKESETKNNEQLEYYKDLIKRYSRLLQEYRNGTRITIPTPSISSHPNSDFIRLQQRIANIELACVTVLIKVQDTQSKPIPTHRITLPSTSSSFTTPIISEATLDIVYSKLKALRSSYQNHEEILPPSDSSSTHKTQDERIIATVTNLAYIAKTRQQHLEKLEAERNGMTRDLQSKIEAARKQLSIYSKKAQA